MTPGSIRPGNRVRGRVTFRLNEKVHPLWNNEADDLVMWVDLPKGVTMVEQATAYPNPETPETRELRQLEFEIEADDSLAEGPVDILAYALYYVCQDEGGVCYYLRQDFTMTFNVDAEAVTLR